LLDTLSCLTFAFAAADLGTMDMGQISLTLNGKIYRMACDDGDEARLQSLAAHVSKKLDHLVGEFGQVGDARLFLMSALLVADELFEIRDLVHRANIAGLTHAVTACDVPPADHSHKERDAG
jgi:cell division protein ZapA